MISCSAPKEVVEMGIADTDRTFHKHLPVTIQRKKFLGKTPRHRAYIQDINLHGGRLLTAEPLSENCHVFITLTDPDTDAERVLCAKVTCTGCIHYHGKMLFQAFMEFEKLTKHDEVMLQNIFYASPM
jgi:hypothetical protein